MDEVNDSENVAEQLDDISLAVPTGDEEIAEVADVESVDDSLPQLEDLNEDLEPSTTLPTPDSAIFAAARKNVDLILPSFSYFNEDFLNDFGLSELFFIDGDSLVAYALGAKELDWKHGGQYLHFIYIVEKLLNSLQERGGRFRVFFFAQNEQLWTGSKLLARQLLIFHLTKNTDVDVDIIPHHIDNVEWKNHIDFFQPAYILAKFEWEEQDEMDYKSLDIIYKALTLALHEHMLYTVILDDIDFKGNKVISFLMEPTEHIRLRAIHQKVLTFLKKHFVAPLANKSSGKKEETTIPYLEKAIEGGFDGRTSLSLVALRSLLNETATPENIALAKLYCVYLSLLQYLPLSARSHQLPPTLPATAFLNAAVPFLRKLASHMQPVLAELAQIADKSAQVKEKLSANFCDAIDGREFLAFLVAYKNEGTGSAPVDAQAEKIWSHLAASVSAIASEKFTFPEQSQTDLNASKTGLDALRSLAQRAGVQNDSLAPVDSEFVNMLVPDIKQKIASVEAKNPSSVVNPETIKNYPWHTGVDFVDNDHLLYKEEQFAAVVKGKAAQDKEEKKRLKWLQKGEATKKKFIDSFLVDSPVKRKLIAELEGPQTREERVKRARKALQPVKAEKEGPSSSKPEKGGKADKAAKKGGKDKKEEKPGKKGAQGKGSQKETGKKEKIIEEAAKKRASEGSEKGKEQLTNILQTVTKLLKQETPVTEAVELLDNFVKSRPADELALEAQLKILGYLHDEFEFAKPERKMEMVPTLFVNVQTILRKYADKDFFTGSGPKKLIKYASHFGFPDLAEAISARIESKSTEKKKEKDKESKLSKALVNIPESSIMYQLKQLGAYLARPQGKVVDDRVPFLPDDWQETLLNVVDAQESALILAPTSSGKTFISFYCMESVLRSDNDSVVVYLSPTKALVNQVEAEVLARFEKKYLPGKVLTGVFTRDFRKNEKDCQVLVTVPDCLELLLLSMDDPAWHKKIKYVIFDEIQSLGSEGGEVWEHLLLLIDAPFLALSATVNNGQQFYDWLSEVERSRNRRMHYIKYDQRYNDLKPYVYDIESKELVSLHPFYALNLRGIQHNNNELPSDLKLLPDHCVTLFESLERHLKPLGVDVSDLHPDTFFKNVQYYEWNLSMMDVVRYENALKQRFLDSIKLSPSPAQTILDDLSGSLPQVFARQTEIYNSNTPGTVLRAHLYDVLQTMKQKDMLPAIIFHFDRIRCEQLAIDLSRQLEGEERAVREKDGTLEKINSLARQIEVEKKWYVRHARDEFSKIDTKNLPESVATRVERYYDMLNHFNFLNRVDPNHSYLGREGAVTWEELCQHLRMREDDIKKVPLYMALRRGIAAHHAGLDKRYRQAVEKLFRLKKVRVVIATATLAVGINMPCKSVIFAGDSPYLNAMNYRQMSGRAGRRGFDLIGHVTFFGVPEGKIKRLTTSRLADMRGNQPLTVAFALRMMCRYNLWNPELEHVPQEEHKQAILAASKRLLERPFIALGKPVVSLNVRHQFRYAIEYLVREGYIGLDGEPRDLCGLVNHLYFLEPANFVFVSLLKMGMFDEFCKTRIKNKDHILQLLVVLSNLFCQLRLYKYQRHGRGPSIVILPALPKEFLEGIEAHNNRALTTAATYMRCFAKSFNAELGEDNTLPLSNVAFAPKSLQVAAGASGAKGGKGKAATGKSDGEDIVSVLKSTAVEYFARSSFSALSGKGDKFDSVSELVGSLRRGLFLDRTLVPTMEIEHEGLNAYIYDLYNHKSTKSLIQFNHVRRDTLYDNLKEFMVVCKTLATALTKRAPQSPVSAEFTQLSDEFSAIFSEYGHLH